MYRLKEIYKQSGYKNKITDEEYNISNSGKRSLYEYDGAQYTPESNYLEREESIDPIISDVLEDIIIVETAEAIIDNTDNDQIDGQQSDTTDFGGMGGGDFGGAGSSDDF